MQGCIWLRIFVVNSESVSFKNIFTYPRKKKNRIENSTNNSNHYITTYLCEYLQLQLKAKANFLSKVKVRQLLIFLCHSHQNLLRIQYGISEWAKFQVWKFLPPHGQWVREVGFSFPRPNWLFSTQGTEKFPYLKPMVHSERKSTHLGWFFTDPMSYNAHLEKKFFVSDVIKFWRRG